jgi:hypothetical protein
MIDVLERFDKLATDAGTIVVQGLGFLGGLADLLATAAMRDWNAVEDIRIGVALDRFKFDARDSFDGEE